jgi:hypothetical protein
MKTIRILIVIAGVLALVGAARAPASAHEDAVYHGKDYAKVYANHYGGEVCDNEKDGHYVFAVFHLKDGTSEGFIGDAYGDGYCTPVSFFSPAVSFSIMEEGGVTYTEKT